MSIAAPPYADSIIVSAPDVVIDRVTASGLEAFRVARSAPLPPMTE